MHVHRGPWRCAAQALAMRSVSGTPLRHDGRHAHGEQRLRLWSPALGMEHVKEYQLAPHSPVLYMSLPCLQNLAVSAFPIALDLRHKYLLGSHDKQTPKH